MSFINAMDMPMIDDVICDNFTCLDIECIHHKEIVRSYMDNSKPGFAGSFLFKMASRNNFYDCSMGYFTRSRTYIFNNNDLTELDQMRLDLDTKWSNKITNSKERNFAYGDNNPKLQAKIQEFLAAREREINKYGHAAVENGMVLENI